MSEPEKEIVFLPDEVGFKLPDVAVTFVDVVKEDVDPVTKVATGAWKNVMFVSPWDGKTYSGDFKVRRLTIGTMGQVGVRYALLTGGFQVDRSTSFLFQMIAYLGVILETVPDWWKPEQHEDERVIKKVYDHVRSWERTFRGARVG